MMEIYSAVLGLLYVYRWTTEQCSLIVTLLDVKVPKKCTNHIIRTKWRHKIIEIWL
jgi:hypothetical protein